MQYKITSVDETTINVEVSNEIEKYSNIIGKYIAFLEPGKKIIGEITKLDKVSDKYTMIIKLVGEINETGFAFGLSVRPSISTELRFLEPLEIEEILGRKENSFVIGDSSLYSGYSIRADMDSFFSSHFCILGSTGSGKSYNIASIFENLFVNSAKPPKNANIVIFDTYGEYASSFEKMFEELPSVNFRNINTDIKDLSSKKIEIPVWLLGVYEWALLLNVTTPLQLPILEKALKLVKIFNNDDKDSIQYKNHILSSALIDILSSGDTPSVIRDQFFSTLTYFNTADINLDSKIVQPGWIRTLRQCLIINDQGIIQSVEVVTNFLIGFINSNLTYESKDAGVIIRYSLSDYKDALEFAIISEGSFKSGKVYDYTNVLKVRLNSLIKSDYKNLFVDKGYSTIGDFLKKLVHTEDGNKIQVINISINHVDDRFAKVITKIFSKFIFDYSSNLKRRASIPFHIILEEAHRYVQNDTDVEVLGYNIFERIAKEGRKFGVMLGLISQRPSELSETVISQCSNFFLFKLVHPSDIAFMRAVIPDLAKEVVNKISYLPVGHCIVFGRSFKIPQMNKVKKILYPPYSGNVQISKLWY